MADGSAGGAGKGTRLLKAAQKMSKAPNPIVARAARSRVRQLTAQIRAAGTGGMKTASRRAG